MNKILIASNNKNKIYEFKEKLKGYEIYSLKDLNIDIDVVEDGNTYEENSYKKAKEISKLAPDYIVISDDSGLEIEALDNYPNIYTGRCTGENQTSLILCNHLLEKLGNNENRNAKYVCVITAIFPNGKTEVIRKEVYGKITKEIVGDTKFGADPIFYHEGYKMTYANMDINLKNKISHRALAINEFVEKLKK